MNKKTRSKKVIIKHIALIVMDVLVMLFTVTGIVGLYIYYKTPTDVRQLEGAVNQTSVIYDRTGEHVLYEIHGEENRKIIAHEEIPNDLRLATISAEDERFYFHSGIDPTAILRALKTDFQTNEMQQGASTITQQLARNAFLTRDKTIKRKIAEIVLAFKIEKKYTKDEILDMYLNEVPYGSNAYGIESAAQTFFGKDAKDLTLDECATLAALPNAPTTLSPYGNNTKELLRRRDKIIDKMLTLGHITSQEAASAKGINTLEKIIPFKQTIDSPHFVFYIKEQLEKAFGKEVVEKGGLKVITTLDYSLQKKAEKTIEEGVKENKEKFNATNAALVAVDPKTGQILAMVGSKDYFDKSIDGQVNVATSPRQPGSSFKPFAYAKAFEKGYQPENLLYDVPTNFGPDGSGNDYTPQNYDGHSHGLVSMRQALAMSLNIPAVKTLYLAGIDDTIDLAHRLGITTLNDPKRYGLALVLGGGEVSLLDETAGYSVFANDGKRNPVTGILRITDGQGNILAEAKAVNSPVIHQQIARKINSILSDNDARSAVFGRDNKLYIPGRVVAAKTGTTQEYRDAWTVGYTPSLAVGVWTGNNNNTTMKTGADGSYVAAPIWNRFMTEALKNFPEENFTDYDHSDAQMMMSSSSQPKITYYNKYSGKKLSEKKKNKTNPDKIEVRYEFPDVFYDNTDTGIPLIVEMQRTSDPMIERWRSSLTSPIDNSNN